MDLQNEFKDLNFGDEEKKDSVKKNVPEQKLTKDLEKNLPESMGDFDESDKILKELEEKLKQIKQEEGEEEYTDEDEETFYEKVQPFIIPICLTIFAIVVAGIFLYFFSQSRIEKTPPAIVNSGNIEPAVTQPVQPQIIVKEEPLKCDPPQILNDSGDACVPAPQEATSTPAAEFEDGTTTIAHVKFSFDKYNYDNSPRGIYMLPDQIFDGDFAGYKINPTNRAYANDHFFGIDRYTVSLIGTCSYVVDDAKILVKNMTKGNNYFTGNVVKVITSSKPRVMCSKGQVEDASVNDPSPGQD